MVLVYKQVFVPSEKIILHFDTVIMKIGWIIDYSYNYDNNYNNNIRRKREIDSLDDCFDDLEEPLYGFRVQVTLAENSPCILGSTCRVNPDFAKRSSDDDIDDEYFSSEDVLDERQTGEEFRSEGSPDCRTTCKK